MSQTITQQLLEQVTALQPKLRARAGKTREIRKVPIETVNE
jgi:hypothetical protein